MNNTRIEELYDQNASVYVLSCLMNNPLLLQNEKYPFTKFDFYKPLHQMVFYAIFNLGMSGAQKISPQDLDYYIKTFTSQYEYYTKNNGYEFIIQCAKTTEDSDGSQFERYYTIVKKFSILRDLEKAGIDTTKFYDPTDILNSQAQLDKLNHIKSTEIIQSVREELVTIENSHIGKDDGTGCHKIGEGMMKLIESLKENPEVGLPINGNMLNFATRGARLGKFYLYSAPSGEGKTRFLVSNACSLSLPRLNESGDKVEMVGGPDGSQYRKVCYITTEQQFDEIQTIVMSYVSGVNEQSILLGKCTPEEWERIKKAQQIIDEYQDNLIVDCIPDPSIEMVKSRLTKYIIQDHVDYIFYDYIFSSPGLVNEFAGSDLREDVVLMMLSNSLKEIAATYNIFLMSATQLNDGWSRKVIGFRDQNCIRGSKAIADKADVGLIGIKLREEEQQQISAIWNEIKKDIQIKYPEIPKQVISKGPNQVLDLYKNRRGEMSAKKLFRYFDYGTCRAYDLFCTDSSYKPYETGRFEYDTCQTDLLTLKVKHLKEEK